MPFNRPLPLLLQLPRAQGRPVRGAAGWQQKVDGSRLGTVCESCYDSRASVSGQSVGRGFCAWPLTAAPCWREAAPVGIHCCERTSSSTGRGVCAPQKRLDATPHHLLLLCLSHALVGCASEADTFSSVYTSRDVLYQSRALICMKRGG